MGMATPGEVELNLASLREHVPAAIWAEAKSQGLLLPDVPTPAVYPRSAPRNY
jgi:hypothetical protein